MELRDWAERVLFGDALQDKLCSPGRISDVRPGAPMDPPRTPGRPAGLALAKTRLRFDLDSPRGRGEVLHAFANHELLALELMALVLLRFPEAPTAFRRGLAATMRDEQAHLQLYLDRMHTAGVEAGDVPVSGFFWEVLRDVPDPRTFVAAMSLGFEQANLDFSRHWRDAFAAVGDHATAEVLDRVYADEIRHVAHGLVWFQRWRDPRRSLFEAWAALLPKPLTPVRGRGPAGSFDAEGRSRAGLPADFVQAVRVHGHSRGRTPRVYWFNPTCEAEIASAGPYTPPRTLADLAHDLAWLPAVLAGEDDVVVAPEPTPAFLETWRRAGFSLPQRVERLEDLRGRRLDSLHPWGWSPAPLPELEVARGPRGWDPASRAHYERRSGHGRRCERLEEVEALAPPFVVKAPLSAAGRERVFSPLDDSARRWITRTLGSQGYVVVEPWLDKVLDLSVQAHGSKILGITRFETDRRGRWLGSFVGPWTTGLTQELSRFVHDDGDRPGWVEAALVAEARAVELAGPYGIDALIHRTPEGLALLPRLELNPRYTMGRVALALRPRARRAWLRIRPRNIELDPVLEDGRLVAGRLALTDPARARGVIAVLEADPPL